MDKMSQKTRLLINQRAFAARIMNHMFARPWMGLVLIISDMLSILLAACVALFLWSFVRSDLIPQYYTILLPFLIVFFLAFTIVGLYPAVGIGSIEEFRRLTISTSLVFLGLGTLSFYLRNVENFSRAVFALIWLFSIILLPINRHAFRKLCVSFGFWGEPITLIGFGKRGARILNVLLEHPEYGLRPTSIIDGFSAPDTLKAPIPYYSMGGDVNYNRISNLEGVKTAILIHSEIPSEFLERIVTGRWHEFGHLIIVPEDQFGSSVWVEAYDLGGLFGMKVRQRLYSRYEQFIKRGLDILLVLLISPFLVALFCLLSIFIRIDSPGPIMYRQTRCGKGGKMFAIWKFRTMVENADELMDHYLLKHPELADEWNRNRKLKNDPRVTRVGKFLRRFSLDELPQILNILQGDMSLVGPRPIVENEIPQYGKSYHLFTRVKPGLTGLWQVSGRNDTSYEQRVQLDLYYINNWSIWFDIYILAKTFTAVLFGKGAY